MSFAPQIRALPLLRNRSSIAQKVQIGDAIVDDCSFGQAHSAILAHAAAQGEPAYVVTANAQHVVLLRQDYRLQEIYRNADLVVADGVSLLLTARLFGRRIRERVTGVDLFQSLCSAAVPANLRVFLLGGRPGTAELAVERLRERDPSLNAHTYCPPLGFENDPVELDRIGRAIRSARPHILFVGLGAPKQEYWIYNYGRKLGVNVSIGVGGSFEMVAGAVKRAPRWIQNLGCEWLYRLSRDPRNKWRRYLIGNLRFLAIILKQRFQKASTSQALRHKLAK